MKKWNPIKISECLNQAFETYTDVLSSSDYSEDDMNKIEIFFGEVIKNEEYLEEYLVIADVSFEPLHSYKYDDITIDKLFEGAIVVVKEGDKTLIIDGSHRFNTLKEYYPQTKALFIILDAPIPVRE